jgi:hypothetical protein
MSMADRGFDLSSMMGQGGGGGAHLGTLLGGKRVELSKGRVSSPVKNPSWELLQLKRELLAAIGTADSWAGNEARTGESRWLEKRLSVGRLDIRDEIP